MDMVETTPEFNMMQLFERAFNPQLCSELAEQAAQRLRKEYTVQINGRKFKIVGNTVCAAQILEAAGKHWCNSTYTVAYREPDTGEVKVLEQGRPVRLDQIPFCAKYLEFWVELDVNEVWRDQRMRRAGL